MVRRRPQVIAVGDAIVDLVTPPMGPLPPGDAQAVITGFDSLPGGNATNFALQIARLSAATTFVGAVGSDANAQVLRAAYRRAGVHAVLRRDYARPTGATIALGWSTGHRTLITARGANASLRASDVPVAALRSVDHFHRAGFWWTTGLIGRPSAELLARARRMGAATSLDISTDPDGWPADHVRAVRGCLPNVDTFFGNETEVCALAGRQTPLGAARRLLALGAGEVVLHRGERGAAAVTQTSVLRSQAFRVVIENPTGCGDVFNAAYVHTRLVGGSVGDALRAGNATAALHLRDRRRPYPRQAEVRRFLRRFSGR